MIFKLFVIFGNYFEDIKLNDWAQRFFYIRLK